VNIPRSTASDYSQLSKAELITMLTEMESRLSQRVVVSNLARGLARLTLAATIILIPCRYRFVLVERPVPPIYKDYTDFLLFASDITLIFTMILWLVGWALEPRRFHPGPLFLTIPLVGLVLFSGIGIFFSVDPQLSLYHTIRLSLLFGLYLYVIQEIKDFRWIIIPAGIQIFIQATIGIAQVIKQASLGLTGLDELALDPGWKGVSIVWAEGIRSLRAYGLSDHPNILGGCLAFGLVLVCAWYVTNNSRQNDTRARLSQPVIVGVFSLGCAGLLVTFSRSAWVAATAATAFLLVIWLQSRQFAYAWKLVGLAAAGLVAITPLVLSYSPYLGVRLNLQNSFDTVGNEFRAINERRLLNSSANTIFAEHALTGVGIGAYPQALRKEYPDFPIDYQPAHFALLAAAVDTGIFGALSYAAAAATPWLALAILWLQKDRRKLSSDLVMTSALLLAIALVGLFDYYTWLLVPGRLWQWLVWGLWSAAYLRFSGGNQDG